MNKKILILLPFILAASSCVKYNGKGKDGNGGATTTAVPTNVTGETGSNTGGNPTTPIVPTSGSSTLTPDEYDSWLNSWSKPGHLYFHYNRGNKFGYENYCLWIWQHSPQDLEGSLWAFSANPKVSDKLTLSPMSNHWMSGTEVGQEGEGTYLDSYGVIADVDLYAANLVGGKTGTSTTFTGMEEIGFLLPQQSSMSGATNWVSDGGRETYLDDIADEKNWRSVQGGKAIHVFVSTGSLYDYTYYAGSGVPEVKTNPIDEDTTGKYRSDIDTAYSNALGNSSTSEAFKELGVGYQIFVASFKDSNGDGIGDIRGIIDSLDYLKDLGVQVLWLTPIQKSDSYHAYDISDYYAVDKRFGTIDDYQELITKAHNQYGMKVLMDLVLNHTSKGNTWFTNSQWGLEENGVNWRDVYTWKYETDLIDKWNGTEYVKITVKEDAESDNPSWYRDGESHYYYYGKFGSGMPEINYLSSATRKIVIDMAKYWMSFGLDGFRLDAVKHIFMRDECYQAGDTIIQDVGSKKAYDDEKGAYITKAYDYSSNLTKNIMWWKEFAHGVKSEYPNCFLVGENFDGWGTRTAPYYQALDSQFSFSTYYHIPTFLYATGGGASNFASKQANETFVPFGSSSTFPLADTGISVQGGGRSDFIDGAFTSNHDVMRAINQVNGTLNATGDGTDANTNINGSGDQVNKAKIHAAVTLLNQGLSWIYYGDELGMSSNTSSHVGKYGSENCEDIWYRQPFMWKDTSKRANYKSGQYTFELDDYNKTLKCVEDQQSDTNSMYNWYKDLIEVKKMYPKAAKIEFHNSSSTNVMVIKVTGEGKALAIYINTGLSDNEYLMNPSSIIGDCESVKTLGGAPANAGGNIGAAKWGISVFRAKDGSTIPDDPDTMPTSGYGLYFSNTKYYVATKVDEFDGFEQYLASNVTFVKDETFSLYNFEKKEGWSVNIDTASLDGNWAEYLKKNDNNYTVLKDFTASSVYIKLKYQQDQVYIGF